MGWRSDDVDLNTVRYCLENDCFVSYFVGQCSLGEFAKLSKSPYDRRRPYYLACTQRAHPCCVVRNAWKFVHVPSELVQVVKEGLSSHIPNECRRKDLVRTIQASHTACFQTHLSLYNISINFHISKDSKDTI